MLSTNFCEWMFQTLTSLGSVSFMYTLWFPSGALRLYCPTSDVPLKQGNRTTEMAINHRKLGWNCDSDKEKRKYNSKNTESDMAFSSMAKRQVWKFRLRTYVIKTLVALWRSRLETGKKFENKINRHSFRHLPATSSSSAVKIPAYQCSANGTNDNYTEIAFPSGR